MSHLYQELRVSRKLKRSSSNSIVGVEQSPRSTSLKTGVLELEDNGLSDSIEIDVESLEGEITMVSAPSTSGQKSRLDSVCDAINASRIVAHNDTLAVRRQLRQHREALRRLGSDRWPDRETQRWRLGLQAGGDVVQFETWHGHERMNSPPKTRIVDLEMSFDRDGWHEDEIEGRDAQAICESGGETRDREASFNLSGRAGAGTRIPSARPVSLVEHPDFPNTCTSSSGEEDSDTESTTLVAESVYRV